MIVENARHSYQTAKDWYPIECIVFGKSRFDASNVILNRSVYGKIKILSIIDSA